MTAPAILDLARATSDVGEGKAPAKRWANRWRVTHRAFFSILGGWLDVGQTLYGLREHPSKELAEHYAAKDEAAWIRNGIQPHEYLGAFPVEASP